jgi:hypothetical protein
MPEPSKGVPRKAIQLISEIADGGAGPDALEQLRQMISDDDRVLQYYTEWMDVHARLHYDLGRGRYAPAATRPLSTTDQEPLFAATATGRIPSSDRRLRLLVAVGAALTIAASLLFIVSSIAIPRQSGRPVARESDNNRDARDLRDFRTKGFGEVAVIAESIDAEWEGLPLLRSGSPLAAQRLKLVRGVAQLEFVSGANVIIEAPAEFEIESPMSLSCIVGKFRTHVPQQAIGFVVHTPEQRVVDLGTEFAVEVGSGWTQVHVLDGEIRLEDPSPKGADNRGERILGVGQGVSRDSNGREQPIVVANDRFIGRQQFSEMSSVATENRRTEWELTYRRQAGDTGALLCFGFEGVEPWERVLRHEGPGEADQLEGAVVGCRWSEGRWPWKHALEFKRTSDRVRMYVPGEYESVTFSCWIRVDGFDRWLSAIVLTDGHELGEPHWQFTETGQLLLGVKSGQKSSEYLSPSVLQLTDLGRWLHLACVYDGPGGMVTHYLDGKAVHSQEITHPTKLRFGDTEIGNWTSKGFLDHTVRSLNGRIDELVLYKRALTEVEVTELYQSGRP